MLYIPVNHFAAMSGQIPGLNIKCSAQGHNRVPQMMLKLGPVNFKKNTLYHLVAIYAMCVSKQYVNYWIVGDQSLNVR